MIHPSLPAPLRLRRDKRAPGSDERAPLRVAAKNAPVAGAPGSDQVLHLLCVSYIDLAPFRCPHESRFYPEKWGKGRETPDFDNIITY